MIYWFPVIQFVAGIILAVWSSHKIDVYDDRMGIRPGASVDGYGSNVSYIWPWSPLCGLGFAMCFFAPFEWGFMR